MTIGIYCIRNIQNDKRYIGKSSCIEHRWWQHKNHLSKPIFNAKACNRHLWNAVQKDGLQSFAFEILEQFEIINETKLTEAELFWMDHFNTYERKHGYNLRRDSSTGMIVHDETKALKSILSLGSNNPNFGNKWSDEAKEAMSDLKRLGYKLGLLHISPEQRARVSAKCKAAWQDEDKRQAMGKKVSIAKRKYNFLQFDKTGQIFIRRWFSIEEIVSENPEFKWQNIYSVCHGHKPTYKGFVWRQEIKT